MLVRPTTPDTTGTRNIDATISFLNEHIKGIVPGTPIPTFQYTDQNGVWYKADKLPSDSAFYGSPVDVLTGASGGTMPIVPIIGGSGPAPQASLPYSLGLASKAGNAVNIAVPTTGIGAGKQVVGAPTLTFDYQGIGTNRFVYAQLVDNKTGLVVGNLVTPVPVTMDGRTHTVTVNMEDIVYTFNNPATDNLTLQITASATPYQNFWSYGVINVSNVNLTMPTPATITPEP